jgi:hypothetical protein
MNSGEGLILNVTHARHVSALGGHFVFSYKKDKQTFVSEVTFVDSKWPTLFCESKQESKDGKSESKSEDKKNEAVSKGL